MADLSDVLNVLVGQVNGIVYPNGTTNPSIVNLPVAVYPGWPDAATLDASMQALNAGGQVDPAKLHVSIYPRPEEKNTTRYQDRWTPLSYAAPTIAVTQDGQQITFRGTVSIPQNIAIVAAPHAAYAYAVQANDTLTSIATAIAALVPGATSSGATVTLPVSVTVTAARVGGSGQLYREHRRQVRQFQITVWANTDANRNALAAAIDSTFAAVEFITLPDGTAGRLKYYSSPIDDKRSQVQIYRRDLFYTVEYPTIEVIAGTEVIVMEQINSVVQADGSTQVASTIYQ